MILTALSLLKTEVSLIFLFWIEVFIKAFLNNIFFLDLLWKAFWFVIFVLSVTCEEHEIEGNISLRLLFLKIGSSLSLPDSFSFFSLLLLILRNNLGILIFLIIFLLLSYL